MRWLGVVIALLMTLSCYSLGQPFNNTTENPDCSSHTHCSSGKACINNKCTDPCLNTCGLNTVCHVVNLRPMCSCKTGYNGHPFTGCNPGLEPQCTTNAHCSKDKECLNQQCVDPCVGVCGVNTECKVVDHYAVCSCSRGFVWNPLSGCVPNIIPECNTNTQCSSDHICINQKCVDPCDGVCGNNTVCHVTNHYPACACKPGYTGDPFQGCTPQYSMIPIENANDSRIYRKLPQWSDILSKKKFFISSNKASWPDAIAGCRQRSMDLASIESQKEQDYMEAAINSSGTNYSLWVSGTDLGVTGSFIWASTGRSLLYSNWKSGQPSGSNSRCLLIMGASSSNPFKWMSYSCSYGYNFVCEYYTL